MRACLLQDQRKTGVERMRGPEFLGPSACEKCKPQYPASEGWEQGELRNPLGKILNLQVLRVTILFRPVRFPMIASFQEVNVVWIPMDLVAVPMAACLQEVKVA